ncbi:hypothetical protein V9K92_01595 [Phyllobacterium sp. CCNWLW109]|uniref:hypothetical protein n=1 Tax=Phyllobacterium sp. CCNWLW109 TaxID=3127479 RepID=UPI003076D1EF
MVSGSATNIFIHERSKADPTIVESFGDREISVSGRLHLELGFDGGIAFQAVHQDIENKERFCAIWLEILMPHSYTTPENVAEVVWRIVTEPDAPMKTPAGADAQRWFREADQSATQKDIQS